MLIWPPSLRTLPQLIFILLDILIRCEFFKRRCFSKWVWWRVITIITWFGRALRWWLSRVRCEHEGLSLSYRTGLSFSLPVLLSSTTTRDCMGSRLIRTCTVCTPGLWWLGSTERTRSENVLFWFGHGGGLVPFGITSKVKSCRGRESFGIQISRRWDCRNQTSG
jgi:hypothetical protein